MAEVRSSDTVAEFQGGHPDQEIGERKADPLGLVLAVDLPGPKRDWHSDGMDGQRCEQFLDELLPLSSSRWRLSAGRTVGQFDQSDN